jgi:hypothetical protein
MKPFALTTAFLIPCVLIAQDKLVLLNGDTISAKITKLSARTVDFTEAGQTFTREMDNRFVNQIILENGKKLETQRDKTVAFRSPEEGNVLILKYEEGLQQQADLIFPKAVKRTFNIADDHQSALVISHFGIPVKQVPLTQRRAVESFNVASYATNAFLVFTEIYEGGVTFTFYSQPINVEKVKNFVVGKKYKLIDSRAAGKLLNMLDNRLKEFTLDFQTESTCVYKTERENSSLEYRISDQGIITFIDPAKKRGNQTAYEIVYFDQEVIRYTFFVKGNIDLITRSIARMNE